jgi:hypothetical protein
MVPFTIMGWGKSWKPYQGAGILGEMRTLHLPSMSQGSYRHVNPFHKEWTEANAFQGLQQLIKNASNETISGF